MPVVAIKMGRMLAETCRRIGVSAVRRLQNVIELRRDLVVIEPCRKAVLVPQTPRRPDADTFPLYFGDRTLDDCIPLPNSRDHGWNTD
jgi:hypothetical protein